MKAVIQTAVSKVFAEFDGVSLLLLIALIACVSGGVSIAVYFGNSYIDKDELLLQKNERIIQEVEKRARCEGEIAILKKKDHKH